MLLKSSHCTVPNKFERLAIQCRDQWSAPVFGQFTDIPRPRAQTRLIAARLGCSGVEACGPRAPNPPLIRSILTRRFSDRILKQQCKQVDLRHIILGSSFPLLAYIKGIVSCTFTFTIRWPSVCSLSHVRHAVVAVLCAALRDGVCGLTVRFEHKRPFFFGTVGQASPNEFEGFLVSTRPHGAFEKSGERLQCS